MCARLGRCWVQGVCCYTCTADQDMRYMLCMHQHMLAAQRQVNSSPLLASCISAVKVPALLCSAVVPTALLQAGLAAADDASRTTIRNHCSSSWHCLLVHGCIGCGHYDCTSSPAPQLGSSRLQLMTSIAELVHHLTTPLQWLCLSWPVRQPVLEKSPPHTGTTLGQQRLFSRWSLMEED
jgi:hypothetical protein